jgi:hypothetical protein
LLGVHSCYGLRARWSPFQRPFAPKASPAVVAHYERSGCFRLERQLPGGISSPHWSDAPFSRRTRNEASEQQIAALENLYRTLDPFALKEAIETKLRAVLRYQIRTPLFKAA